MIFQGRFRTVRHADHAVPTPQPRPLLGPGACLDIRAWRGTGAEGPRLLVTTARKTGPAVRRNQFRRRVRMAFLACLAPVEAQPWVVWVRPGRTAPPLDRIPFQDIQTQLQLALRRLPAPDRP